MLRYEKIVDDIFLISSDSSFWFKCQGIVIKNKNSGNILIDTNCYYKNEIENLLKEKIEAYFVSHVHLDHVYNLHYYEEFNPNIKIYCPIPENEYIMDFNKFVRANGTFAFGIEDNFREFAFKELGFKEIKYAIGFRPETEFEFDSIKIKSIPIPGHSPAQSAFSIEDTNETSKKKVLFVSDIGLTEKRAWAWHGFKYSNLEIFRESIKRIENVYLNDDYIIASSHGPIIFEKQPDIFNKLLISLEKTEKSLLNMLHSKKPKGLKELMFKGLIFPVTMTKPIEKGGDPILTFFENNMILHHIDDLLERGIIIDKGNNQWILNS